MIKMPIKKVPVIDINTKEFIDSYDKSRDIKKDKEYHIVEKGKYGLDLRKVSDVFALYDNKRLKTRQGSQLWKSIWVLGIEGGLATTHCHSQRFPWVFSFPCFHLLVRSGYTVRISDPDNPYAYIYELTKKGREAYRLMKKVRK